MLRSFRARLTVALLALVLLPTVALSWLGYSAARATVEREALRTVGMVASERHEALSYRLNRTQERMAGFLSLASHACTTGGTGPAPACVRALLTDFIEVEHASEARVEYPGLPGVVVGPEPRKVEQVPPVTEGQLAWFEPYDGGPRHYVQAARSEAGRGMMVMRFSPAEIDPIFRAPPGLGEAGETFLADAQGLFITAPKFSSHSGHSHPIAAAPMKACLAGQGHVAIGPDYRERPVVVVHGYERIPEIGGGCIMAHIDREEVLGPVHQLARRLWALSLLFVVCALAGAWMVARGFALEYALPIARLADRARLAEGGDLETPVPIEGPAELRVFAEGFRAMATSLRQALRDREDHVGFASHDLRSPLTALELQVESLRRKLQGEQPLPGRELLPRVERMARSTERMKRLVEGLLDVAKIRAGQLQLVTSETDLAAVAAEAVELVRPLADERHVRIEAQLPTEGCVLACDPDLMHQVFSNLLGNAQKHAAEGGLVTMRLTREAGEIRCAVSDDGPGIAAEQLEHLFERFWRGVPGGAGLGLFITRAVVNAHGGRLWAESKEGQGSTFFLSLPVSRGPTTAVPGKT